MSETFAAQVTKRKRKSETRISQEARIASYESLPINSGLEWNKSGILVGLCLPSYGQSVEWCELNMSRPAEYCMNINNKLQIYLSNNQCKSAPFFPDDAPTTLAMNMFYLFTKYLFINKTGLELEIRSPKYDNLCIKEMEVSCEIFENERCNVHNEWVKPFEPGYIASQCDATNRRRDRHQIILPNKKWKWK